MKVIYYNSDNWTSNCIAEAIRFSNIENGKPLIYVDTVDGEEKIFDYDDIVMIVE